jgi:hypothetical protein
MNRTRDILGAVAALAVGLGIGAAWKLGAWPGAAQAEIAGPVELFQERMATFKTLYLPIPYQGGFSLFSADARVRRFQVTWLNGVEYDGTQLSFRGTPASAEANAAVAALWDEALEGFPDTDFVEVEEVLPYEVARRLGRGHPYRVDLPFVWPGSNAVDVVLGLDDRGTPTGLAIVAAGTAILVAADQQRWVGGFSPGKFAWDVPLEPGLGTLGYHPEPPCGYRFSMEIRVSPSGDLCKTPLQHKEYHAAYLRYEVAIDAAASLTNGARLGWAATTHCAAPGQVVTAPIDIEFPVRTTDEGYARMVAAQPHCPIRVTLGGLVSHIPRAQGAKTSATGLFELVDKSTNPPTSLFSQTFNENAPGPAIRQNPRSKKLDLAPGQALDKLVVRWSGTMAITCQQATPAGVESMIAVVGDEPLFQWDCLPNDPPSSL